MTFTIASARQKSEQGLNKIDGYTTSIWLSDNFIMAHWLDN